MVGEGKKQKGSPAGTPNFLRDSGGVSGRGELGEEAGDVVEGGLEDMEEGGRFGLRVLLWRWRWMKAWEMSVYRDVYMMSGRMLEKHGLLQFGDEWIWDEGDNLHKMMARDLREEKEVGGSLWEGIHGRSAWMSYNSFEREVWVYWCVDMYRAWEARFTSGGRRRRAEAKWRGDRKVGKVWWRWGRRMGGPHTLGTGRGGGGG